MPERAKLLLVFRVPNGPIAEKAFHAALKSKGRHINEAVGKEWFKKGKGDIVLIRKSRMSPFVISHSAGCCDSFVSAARPVSQIISIALRERSS
jgi:hypothetical protein